MSRRSAGKRIRKDEIGRLRKLIDGMHPGLHREQAEKRLRYLVALQEERKAGQHRIYRIFPYGTAETLQTRKVRPSPETGAQNG